jgi:poly-gamma-glutamate synthesis protein (capsule biosynthesis protein)
VVFLGDTLVGGEGQAVLDEHGPGWAFDGIRDLLAGSDLVVANHEGPITEQDAVAPKLDTGRKRYWYRSRATAVPALVDAGVRVVSLANNHVLDHGADALLETIDHLDAAGIAHCGAGRNRAEARVPAVVGAGGLRFGFVSVMQRYDIYVAEQLYAARERPGPARFDARRMQRDLGRLGETVDVKVVLVHWGRNYKGLRPAQRRIARHLVDAGADLVIGHHPHVPHPIEIIDGVPVLYSLGNGPLGTPGRYHSGRLPYGLVVAAEFDGAGPPTRFHVTPILVDNAEINFQPRVANDDTARAAIARVLRGNLPWVHAGATFSAEIVQASSATASVNASSQRSAPASSAAR